MPRIAILMSSTVYPANLSDFVITISLPLVVGLIAMAPTLIYLFCGEEYVPSISCMQIAAPIILFISVSYVFAQLMYAIGKENVTIIMGVCGAVINLCVNLLLIPQYAQNGASFATLLAELGVMSAYVIVGRRYFKIDIFKRRNLSPLVAVAVMGAVIVPLQFAEMPHLVNLFVTPLVGAVAYGTVLWKMRDTMFLEMIAIVLQKIKRKMSAKTAVLLMTFARSRYARQVFDRIKDAKPEKFYFTQ